MYYLCAEGPKKGDQEESQRRLSSERALEKAASFVRKECETYSMYFRSSRAAQVGKKNKKKNKKQVKEMKCPQSFNLQDNSQVKAQPSLQLHLHAFRL